MVGAGAFGAWTARWLLRRGASVTLVDQYGPGNSLSSLRRRDAGDAIRPRCRRALRRLAAPRSRAVAGTGPVAVRPDRRPLAGATRRRIRGRLAPDLERLGIAAQRLGTDALRERFPQMLTDDVAWALFEPDAGVLMARRAVAATARAVADEGGEVRGRRGWTERRSSSTTRWWMPTRSFSPPARGCRSCWDRSPASISRSLSRRSSSSPRLPGDARFDAGTCRRGSSTTQPSTGCRRSRDAGQGRAGLAGTDRRPRRAGAPPLRRADRRLARLSPATAAGPRGSSGWRRVESASTSHAGHALPHRPPPDDAIGMDRRRRLGARVQARTRGRRVRQRARRQRRCQRDRAAGRPVRAPASPCRGGTADVGRGAHR